MQERQTKILELLTEYKKIEVVRLSKLLQVSQVTIRKDLDQLERQGIVKREHGYAELNSNDDINSRLAYHFDIKQRIARHCAGFVEDGETIMIESGSCCVLLAEEIARSKRDVTIVTNSAFIADYIRKREGVHIILLGGDYQPEAQVMVGPMTRKNAEMFFVDKLFVGTDGYIEEYGFTGSNYMRSEAVRDMARQAKHVFVLSESTKFTQRGTVTLLPFQEVNTVVTDKGIPSEAEEKLKACQIRVEKLAV